MSTLRAGGGERAVYSVYTTHGRGTLRATAACNYTACYVVDGVTHYRGIVRVDAVYECDSELCMACNWFVPAGVFPCPHCELLAAEAAVAVLAAMPPEPRR